jgi:hypothetical protein
MVSIATMAMNGAMLRGNTAYAALCFDPQLLGLTGIIVIAI